MDDTRFITRPMSIVLDALRFAAAFLVMNCHMEELAHYPTWGSATPRLSHYSVIVFFVLSGLVIDASVADRRTDLKSYAAARIARIMVVAIPAILVSALVCWWAAATAGALPDGFAGSVAWASISALLFLNETPYGVSTFTNGAYWSLCYEVWYYALFAAAIFLKGPLRLLVLAAMAWVMGVKLLLLLPVWLAGVWLNRAPVARSIPLERAVPVLLACAVGINAVMLWDAQALYWWREVTSFSLGYSEWVASDYAMAVFFVAALAALRPLAGRFAGPLERIAAPAKYLAGFSFTLYLFHHPLAVAMGQLGLARCDTALEIIAFEAFILAACAAIASVTEAKAPILRKALMSAFTSPRIASPALH